MKKTFLAVLMCAAVAIPVALTGCGTTTLKDSPTKTASTSIYGSALTYNNAQETKYIYFANAFQTASSMESGYDAKNTALKRIALNADGKITFDATTKLPTNIETVLERVVGSDYTFMYSSGNYIYFATPCNDVDPTTRGEHLYTHNQYYRINTDGSGLTKFYTSSNSVTQQTVLTINGKEYLLMVDGTNLVKVELGKTISKAQNLAKDFASVIFATEYKTAGDEIAYYTTTLPEEVSSRSGNLLFAVNIVTGENLGGKDDTGKDKAINSSKPCSITLKEVCDGALFFTTTDSSSNSVYVRLSDYTAFDIDSNVIATAVDNVSDFKVVVVQDNPDAKQVYYVFSDSNADKSYALPAGTIKFSENQLIDEEIDVVFASGDYVYYTYVDPDDTQKGFYRISVRDKSPEVITDMSDIKTTNMSFDGKYVYFFAKNTDNTTGTYYMHRANATLNSANSELISELLDADKPSEE